MKLLKKRANVPVETSISAWVGYDDDHIYTMGCVYGRLCVRPVMLYTLHTRPTG